MRYVFLMLLCWPFVAKAVDTSAIDQAQTISDAAAAARAALATLNLPEPQRTQAEQMLTAAIEEAERSSTIAETPEEEEVSPNRCPATGNRLKSINDKTQIGDFCSSTNIASGEVVWWSGSKKDNKICTCLAYSCNKGFHSEKGSCQKDVVELPKCPMQEYDNVSSKELESGPLAFCERKKTGQCKIMSASVLQGKVMCNLENFENGFCSAESYDLTKENNTLQTCQDFCKAKSQEKKCVYKAAMLERSKDACICNPDSEDFAEANIYKEVCGKDKGKTGKKERCIKDFFNWTQTQLRQALALAKDYARITYKEDVWCVEKYRTSGNDDYIKCATKDESVYYEFKFDDVSESIDATRRKSERSALCRLMGGELAASTNAYSAASAVRGKNSKCANIGKSECDELIKMAKRYGHSVEYDQKKNICLFSEEGDKNVKTSEEFENSLAKIEGLDNYYLFDEIQIRGSANLIRSLRTYVKSKLPDTKSFTCDDGYKTVKKADGILRRITGDTDDILRCYVDKKPMDFVFDDLSEAWRTTREAGESGIACKTKGGAYARDKCHGLDKATCDKIDADLKRRNPKSSGTRFVNGECELIDGQEQKALEDGIQATMGMVALVDCAVGTHLGCVLAVVEGVSLGVEMGTGEAMQDRANAFLKEATKCYERSCAIDTLRTLGGRVLTIKDALSSTSTAKSVDEHLARLIGYLEPEDLRGDVSEEDWNEIVRQLGGDPEDSKGRALKIANKIGFIGQFASVGASTLNLTGKAIAKLASKSAAKGGKVGTKLVKIGDKVADATDLSGDAAKAGKKGAQTGGTADDAAKTGKKADPKNPKDGGGAPGAGNSADAGTGGASGANDAGKGGAGGASGANDAGKGGTGSTSGANDAGKGGAGGATGKNDGGKKGGSSGDETGKKSGSDDSKKGKSGTHSGTSGGARKTAIRSELREYDNAIKSYSPTDEASAKKVKAVFKKLMGQYHPDKVENDAKLKELATEICARLGRMDPTTSRWETFVIPSETELRELSKMMDEFDQSVAAAEKAAKEAAKAAEEAKAAKEAQNAKKTSKTSSQQSTSSSHSTSNAQNSSGTSTGNPKSEGAPGGKQATSSGGSTSGSGGKKGGNKSGADDFKRSGTGGGANSVPNPNVQKLKNLGFTDNGNGVFISKQTYWSSEIQEQLDNMPDMKWSYLNVDGSSEGKRIYIAMSKETAAAQGLKWSDEVEDFVRTFNPQSATNINRARQIISSGKPITEINGIPVYVRSFGEYGNRPIVMVEINGKKLPFYASSGSAGKTKVATGKWEFFGGIGPDGWFNKGSSIEEIANHYNSPELRKIAQALDDQIGDVRNVEYVMMSQGRTALNGVGKIGGIDGVAELSEDLINSGMNDLGLLPNIRGLGVAEKNIEKVKNWLSDLKSNSSTTSGGRKGANAASDAAGAGKGAKRMDDITTLRNRASSNFDQHLQSCISGGSCNGLPYNRLTPEEWEQVNQYAKERGAELFETDMWSEKTQQYEHVMRFRRIGADDVSDATKGAGKAAGNTSKSSRVAKLYEDWKVFGKGKNYEFDFGILENNEKELSEFIEMVRKDGYTVGLIKGNKVLVKEAFSDLLKRATTGVGGSPYASKDLLSAARWEELNNQISHLMLKYVDNGDEYMKLTFDSSNGAKGFVGNVGRHRVFLEKLPTASGGSSEVVNIADRAVVVVNVDGHRIPFYVSSGQAGKDALGIPSGKWYPIAGIGKDGNGWFNKMPDMMNNPVPELDRIVSKLESQFDPQLLKKYALNGEIPEAHGSAGRIINSEFKNGVVPELESTGQRGVGYMNPKYRPLFEANIQHIKDIFR